MVKTKEEYLEKAEAKKKDTQEKRKPKTKKKEKNVSLFSRIHTYFKGVRSEMKKTKWPSKKEMLLYSSATLLFIVIFALFFTLNDVVISAVKQLVR
ncbi:MAG: preprotein translocase subunit SecE [Bacilli bacterium]|nr:preprotein translocase subunit SecE [Bacilli bacterium]